MNITQAAMHSYQTGEPCKAGALTLDWIKNKGEDLIRFAVGGFETFLNARAFTSKWEGVKQSQGPTLTEVFADWMIGEVDQVPKTAQEWFNGKPNAKDRERISDLLAAW